MLSTKYNFKLFLGDDFGELNVYGVFIRFIFIFINIIEWHC